MIQIIKVWDKQLGLWKYSCGCIQFQDGYELCSKHKPGGYISLLEENILEEPRTAAGSLD